MLTGMCEMNPAMSELAVADTAPSTADCGRTSLVYSPATRHGRSAATP